MAGTRSAARLPGGAGDGVGHLEARLAAVRGTMRLDVALAVEPGEVVALVGPNGAGKTTTLDLLAGLTALDSGHVRVGGVPWEDTATGVRVRPEDRPLGVVFQDHLLFPHLTALENVAFGLRARGVPRRLARARAHDWLRRVGLGERSGERPGRLSGGEVQRVALARALVTDPAVLLLDEPLSALDARTRAVVRAELGRHLGEYRGCCLLVTHDAVDAMVLADRVVVIEDGRLVQVGTPVEVARAPRSDYVARLVGLNLYRGSASGSTVALDGGGALTVAEVGAGAVLVAVPPGAVALHRVRPEGSPRNVWPGVVAAVEQHGDAVRVGLDGSPPVLADVTAAAVAELRIDVGARVWASVKANQVHAYPA